MPLDKTNFSRWCPVVFPHHLPSVHQSRSSQHRANDLLGLSCLWDQRGLWLEAIPPGKVHHQLQRRRDHHPPVQLMDNWTQQSFNAPFPLCLLFGGLKRQTNHKKKTPNKPHFGYIPFTGGDHEVICAFGLKFNDSGKLLFLEAALKLSMSSLFVACQSRNDDVPGWALSSTPDVGGHHATKSLAIVWGWILPCTVGVRGEDHGPQVCSPYLYKSVFPVR